MSRRRRRLRPGLCLRDDGTRDGAKEDTPDDGITVVGGGIAGLVAANACAEAGATVTLREAHRTLGGRTRTTPPACLAGGTARLLCRRAALNLAGRARADRSGGPAVLARARAVRFRHGGAARVVPPAGLLRMLADRRPGPRRSTGTSPVGPRNGTARRRPSRRRTFSGRSPSTRTRPALRGLRMGAVAAGDSSAAAGGALRHRRVDLGGLPAGRPRRRAGGGHRDRGPGRWVPDPPVIVATELAAARRLLADPALVWVSGSTVLLDVGLRAWRGDAFVVFDLEEAGILERYSSPDPALAPAGHSLVQAQMPLGPGEPGPPD